MNVLLDWVSKMFPDRGTIPNKFTLAMGQKIQHAREESGLSIKELAENVCLSSSTLGAYEKGTREVPTTHLTYLADTKKKH